MKTKSSTPFFKEASTNNFVEVTFVYQAKSEGTSKLPDQPAA